GGFGRTELGWIAAQAPARERVLRGLQRKAELVGMLPELVPLRALGGACRASRGRVADVRRQALDNLVVARRHLQGRGLRECRTGKRNGCPGNREALHERSQRAWPPPVARRAARVLHGSTSGNAVSLVGSDAIRSRRSGSMR